MIYKKIIDRIDKKELEIYYNNHLSKDVLKYFNIPSNYILNRILDDYNIRRRTPSETTQLQFKLML